MALEGSLSDFGLADILQLIYFQKKTGLLTLSGNRDRVRLTFVEGNIGAAESRRRTEENRLGRILLKKRLITEADLKAALAEQKATGVRIGDILINKGLVDGEAVRETLVAQITATVVQLFSWKEGTYEFQTQAVVANTGTSISLDTQHLLMEGLRVLDEWTLIEGKITLDTVFRKTESGALRLTEDEGKVLAYVDGENDVSGIIDLSGMGDFETSKILVSLMEKEAIEPVEVSPVMRETEAAPPAVRERSFAGFLPLVVLALALVVAFAASALRKERVSAIEAFLGGGSMKGLKAARDIETLRLKAEAHRYGTGSYPPALAVLGKAEDPWGRPYTYRADGENLIIISAGPDGKIGTEDDVY